MALPVYISLGKENNFSLVFAFQRFTDLYCRKKNCTDEVFWHPSVERCQWQLGATQHKERWHHLSIYDCLWKEILWSLLDGSYGFSFPILLSLLHWKDSDGWVKMSWNFTEIKEIFWLHSAPHVWICETSQTQWCEPPSLFLIQQKDHEEECVEPYLEYHVRYTDNNYVFEQWHPCLSGNKYFQNTNDSVRLMKPKMNKSIFLGHGSVR